MKNFKIYIYVHIFLIIIIAASATVFMNKSNQSINWTYPYFSGAANFKHVFEWKISKSDYNNVRNLSDLEYRSYKHKGSNDLITNKVNNYGYLLVALISMKIFPNLGDLWGIIFLQLLCHTFTSVVFITHIFKTQFQRIGFLLLYAINPFIIHYVTFPFYYFWLSLPSFFLAALILKPEWRNWLIYLATPFLIFSILIRSTSVFLVLIFYIQSYLYTRYRGINLKFISLIGVFFVSLYFISKISNRSPWHTVYIGLGAYPNSIGINDLSDEVGHQFFYNSTGITINTNAVYGNWNDPSIQEIYSKTLKNRCLGILYDNPKIYIKNAILNTIQIFSLGYFYKRPGLTYFSIFIGFAVIIFLYFTNQIKWIIAILSSGISFSLYFPPIPAYNFAAYLLIVIACLLGLENFIKNKKLKINIFSNYISSNNS
jgi:hypothetical protein